MRKRKSEILQFRLTSEDKKAIEKGAASRNLEVSDYIRMHILEAVKKDVEAMALDTKVILTAEEWKRFMDIMETQAPENPHLKKAFRELRQFEADHESIQENYG